MKCAEDLRFEREAWRRRCVKEVPELANVSPHRLNLFCDRARRLMLRQKRRKAPQ